jgi:hypothetical protein
MSAGQAVVFVLDVDEFRPLVDSARAMAGVQVSGPRQGYLRIASSGPIEFSRKQLGFKPAIWYGALTGGLVGRVAEFSRDTLRVEAV